MYIEQFKAERFYSRKHSVERRLVRQWAGQYRVRTVRRGVQCGEGSADRPAKAAPDADLVPHLAPRAGACLRVMSSSSLGAA